MIEYAIKSVPIYLKILNNIISILSGKRVVHNTVLNLK